jgi:hypothetical protein
MALSKKHYVVLAEILALRASDASEDALVMRRCIARDLADYFERDNPLFQRDRFLTAARVTP